MADERPVAPALVAEATPAPVVTEPVAPAPEGAPIAEPAATIESAPAEAPKGEEPKSHTDKPSLLEEVAKPVEPPEGDKTAEAPKPETPKVEFQPYKLPEDVKLDQKAVAEFNDIIAKEMSPQERGQALLERYVSEMKNYDAQLRQQQQAAFSDTRAEWVKQVMSDEELGGNGWNTTKIGVAKMRDLFVSSSKPGTDRYASDMNAFNDFLRVTGAGDHPAFWRLMNNVARKFDEPSAPVLPYNPPPDIGRKAGANGRRIMYDHPSSAGNK